MPVTYINIFLKKERENMSYNEGMSPADYAALNGNNRNDGMWGDGGWFWIIILLAAFGGFGEAGAGSVADLVVRAAANPVLHSLM
jgi:hypothetical protein